MEGSSGSNVVIVMATYYPGKTESEQVRSALAVDTIRRAVELGYPIVVLDGGSSDDLVLSFQAAGAKVQQQKTATYGESRRLALKAAAELGKEIIAWTEPEKVSFISQVAKTVRPFLEERVDVVIPARRSLSSYPIIQQHAEAFGNEYFKALTGKDLDMWFGPRVFRAELVSYFLNYDGSFGDQWEAMYIPVLDMMKDEKKILSVVVDYEHPKEQTAVEENDLEFYNKRFAQLNNLVPALRTHWKKIQK